MFVVKVALHLRDHRPCQERGGAAMYTVQLSPMVLSRFDSICICKRCVPAPQLTGGVFRRMELCV